MQEAARRLSLTESAIRKRVRKGQIPHDKESDGRVYVYLERSQTEPELEQESSYALLVERLENENEFLRRQLERKDALLLNMTEAMKALSAPSQEPQNQAESAGSRSDRVETNEATEEQEKATERPWWRRWFR